MATRKIETTIALDGEQAFKQGLASAAREMRVLESESKALAAGFGTSGDAAASAAAKQNNLRNQIAQQEQIVSALERAVKDAAAAYGDSSAEVDGYAVKLNNARTKLANLQKALSNADREVEELGRDSQKAGTQISQGIGEGAQEAENDIKSLMSSMKDSLTSIQGSATFQTIGGMWDMAQNAWGQVSGFVDSTADFRRQLAQLQLSASQHGFDFKDLKDQMTSIAGVTGDASTAIEGLINLVSTGMSSYQLERATEGILGATLQFPDMDFNSIAQGMQETLATGSAAGAFEELIERLGGDVEAFNTALANSPTLAGDVDIALAQLAAGGLNQLTIQYTESNAALTEAQQLKTQLEIEQAELANAIEQYITNPVRKKKLEVLQRLNMEIEQYEQNPDAYVENLGGRVGELADLAIDAADAYVGDGIGALGVANTSKAAEAIMNKAKEAQQQGEEVGQDYAAGLAEGLAEGFDATLDLTNAESKAALPLKQIGEKSMDDVLESIDLEAYYAEMEGAGKEGGEKLTEGFDAGVAGGDASAANAGAAFGAAYAKGILSQVSYVSSAAASLAAAAAARVQGGISGVAGMVGGVLNIDGRAAGTFLAPYVSDAMTVSVE